MSVLSRKGNVIAVNFGRDTWCTDRLRSGRMVTGAELVAQACYRRLITPRGMLRGGPDEALYGLDLSAEIGRLTSPSEEAALPGRIKTQLMLDERLDSVSVKVTKTVEGPAVEYEIEILGETAAGPFELVLGVSAVTVEILKLEAA